jgi:hypothetical protein
VCSWTAFWTYVILYLIRSTVGTDVGIVAEELGLDITQLGEKAYDTDLNFLENVGKEVLATRLLDAAAAGDLNMVIYVKNSEKVKTLGSLSDILCEFIHLNVVTTSISRWKLSSKVVPIQRLWRITMGERHFI